MDNSEKIVEGKWCDHIHARGQWIRGEKPTIAIVAPEVHIIIEEGIVKILCPACFLKAIQLPLAYT